MCLTGAPSYRGQILRLNENSQELWGWADHGLESPQLCDFEQSLSHSEIRLSGEWGGYLPFRSGWGDEKIKAPGEFAGDEWGRQERWGLGSHLSQLPRSGLHSRPQTGCLRAVRHRSLVCWAVRTAPFDGGEDEEREHQVLPKFGHQGVNLNKSSHSPPLHL